MGATRYRRPAGGRPALPAAGLGYSIASELSLSEPGPARRGLGGGGGGPDEGDIKAGGHAAAGRRGHPWPGGRREHGPRTKPGAPSRATTREGAPHPEAPDRRVRQSRPLGHQAERPVGGVAGAWGGAASARLRKAASIRNLSVSALIFLQGAADILTPNFIRLSMIRSGMQGYRRSYSARSLTCVHDVTSGYDSFFSSSPWGAVNSLSEIPGKVDDDQP